MIKMLFNNHFLYRLVLPSPSDTAPAVADFYLNTVS